MKGTRKLIDIPENQVVPLKVLAAAENKNLKNYIEDLLTGKILEKKELLKGLGIEFD